MKGIGSLCQKPKLKNLKASKTHACERYAREMHAHENARL